MKEDNVEYMESKCIFII